MTRRCWDRAESRLIGRHGPGQPVWVSPVREIVVKDLAMLCHLFRLQTVPQHEVPALGRQQSINALSERFIAGLQAKPALHREHSLSHSLQIAGKPMTITTNAQPHCQI